MTEKQIILVVDDEPDIRELVGEILEDEGYHIITAESAEQAREKRRLRRPDLVLLDIWMPGDDGISLLKSWKQNEGLCCPVIMMSGHGTIETAVEATRLGAYDYIEKPLSMAKMLLTIENALRSGQLEQENKGLKKQLQIPPAPIGSSDVMVHLREQALRVAKHGSVVLLYGEVGSGKEIFAHYIHTKSDRSSRPFVKSIVSSYTEDQTDTELATMMFGRVEGDKIEYGLFDEGQGGCLYLVDINALPSSLQLMLLMVLRDGFYMRVDSFERIELDMIIITSAQHDLRDDIEADRFNDALYDCLNIVPLYIPALREHTEDVSELLNYYVDQQTLKDGLPYRHFSVAAQNFLRNYRWLGNIRELRNLVQRLLILGTDTEIDLDEVEETLGASIPIFEQGIDKMLPGSLYDMPLRQAREQFEHDYLSYQLTQCGGNVSKLAERVKMERTHLYRKMRSLGIDPKKFSK
ncbi:MAG: sigma-54-dependent Fis family transcriptional regulator [Cocleimonas sp.]|nr:sigma-54-dependent Fis family transcriptional regulator [Cocleimonas sp.]